MAPTAEAVAEAPVKAKKSDPKPCACGCGGMTGGGLYRIGHDAKHKSALIAAALAGDKAAESTLASKNWTKFLVTKREVLAKKAAKKVAAAAEKTAEGAAKGK